ncbi:hypothetical protein H8K35_01760 [Undibacterium sp. LX40W]|uniref:LiaF transmembrane domain-containing protein n=1 Tax=Undibacterium nitidum TaxID=2762298 RepID=A0A923KT34_9BURK|nr:MULTISPECIES: DUF5668 domain-containing protein [Undibacterium]MBC3880892.1 hypothetical protein [Undibacterium nitidum]MBC3890375.1 hypothetical protein [Undibacterium sp. LX40W]
MRNRNRDPQQRLVFGILIMVVGVLALLDNLRIFEGIRLVSFWPAVFIVGGILKMSQSQARSGYVIGAIFIAVGSIMTLNNLGVISIRMRDFWPLILIAVGFLVIFKDKAKQTMDEISTTKINESKEGKIDIIAIMSGSQGNIASANFTGGDITAVMGGVELDLRNASIETEAVLNVFTFWGGISLKIPNDWSVVNSANAVLGGIEDSTVPNMSANKRLIITGTSVMGGVEIKN